MSEVLTQPNPTDSAAAPEAQAPVNDSAASPTVVATPAANGATTTPTQEPTTPTTPPNNGAVVEPGAEAGLDVGTNSEQEGSAPEKSRDAYRKRREEALRKYSGQPEVKAPEVIAPPVALPQAAQAAPAAAVTPPAPPETPPTQDPDERPTANSVRLPTKDDPVAFQAAIIYKQSKANGTPISLAEAERRAMVFVTGSEKAPESAPAQAAPPVAAATQAETPDTLESINTRIEELRAEKSQHHSEFNFDHDTEIDGKVDALLEKRFALKHAPPPAAAPEGTSSAPPTATDAQFAADWNAGIASAVKLYGDQVNDPNSALSRKAVEIQQRMKEQGDPLYLDPRSARLIYMEAAEAIGLAPAATSVPPSQPAPPRPTAATLLASGVQAGGTAQQQPAGEHWKPSRSRTEYTRRKTAMGIG